MSEQAPSNADFIARIAFLEAAVCARDIAIAERDEQLRRERAEAALRIDRFNRKAFGRSSEKLGQMQLELEDLETDFAASVPDLELPIVADSDKVRVLPVRKLNPTLPRKRVVREPSCACCPGCGGDLRAMGEDSEEMLDLVAQAWQVMETIRPKYSCRTCDKIIQAPAPAKAIARGKLSYAALAHIMMAKWGYHLPFYRQAQMMAAKGVDIERSTLARSAGYAAALLDPIYNRIREIGLTRSKIHTDDTRLPILAPGNGKTHKGALWVYVADDRNSGSKEPPIAWYRATMGRAGESVMSELAGFSGTLQADGFSGYNQLYKGGAIREAACLAHLRRKIFDVHDSQPTELSTTAMAGIQAIYRIEEEIRGLPPAERLAARRRRTRPLVLALRRQLTRQGKGLSRHADIAKAFAYGTNRWRAFNRFLYDGQLEPDNLIAERAIRGFTVGRRNWLFSGSFAAAERSAVVLSIIETCKLCGVDAEAYMADITERIQNDWPASRWDELMPWNWVRRQAMPLPLAA
ncbi:transposase [Mesorhizobium robiniae]|uniref:Transposase n=1 Tax=Mesorhizobium robiniae TaxID=559315 RepID=A0ABV2GZI2_9HYPH|nr:IS66 family transposase [Mesorhizobium sp. ZC-5]MCV3244022.1 IS66 family transposase [Mesorhizobium sp. ZC-5]